jgi:hypothetical protein
MISTSDDSEEDDQPTASTAELREFFQSKNVGGKPSNQPEVDTASTLVATGRSSSPGSRDESDMGCGCLKRLADHMCHLNMIERKQDIICLDTTLAKTHATVSCAENTLECPHCRLDAKVVLLIMTTNLLRQLEGA